MTRYLSCNIHTQKGEQRGRAGHLYTASYAHFTAPGAGHVIIPMGTPVAVLNEPLRNGFYLQTKEQRPRRILFEYNELRMKMPMTEYFTHILASEPPKLEEFSVIDRKGIREGKAYEGMTRKGVMKALGYPATHRTPTLGAKEWVYWTNRFSTVVIIFGDDGLVQRIDY